MNPMIVYGVTGKARKFHGCFSVLAHDEKDMEQSVHFQLLYMREDLIQSLGWVTVPLPLQKLVKNYLLTVINVKTLSA